MRQKQTRWGAFAADTPACSELPLRQHQQNPLKKRSFQQPVSLTVSQNFGICSEPRSMGNAIAWWRERPPISVALLQSS
jgi:hypothetical protein